MRYERLVCCYPRRHSVLVAKAREQQPDARLLDPKEATALELAADAFDGVLHMQSGINARFLVSWACFAEVCGTPPAQTNSP